MKLALLCAAMTCFAAAAPTLAADSAYTTHAYEKCPLVQKDAASQQRRCKGLGGIVVNYYGEDDAAAVDFGQGGSKEDDPYEPSFVFAGKTIEWRGDRNGGRLVPYAAIVRYDVGHAIGGPFRPELMIFRLDGTKGSCRAASVDGRRSDANAKARELADTFVRGFTCGKDKRRPME